MGRGGAATLAQALGFSRAEVRGFELLRVVHKLAQVEDGGGGLRGLPLDPGLVCPVTRHPSRKARCESRRGGW